jgi:hypothetical protein
MTNLGRKRPLRYQSETGSERGRPLRFVCRTNLPSSVALCGFSVNSVWNLSCLLA